MDDNHDNTEFEAWWGELSKKSPWMVLDPAIKSIAYDAWWDGWDAGYSDPKYFD